MSSDRPSPLRYAIIGTWAFEDAKATAEALRESASRLGRHCAIRFLMSDAETSAMLSRVMPCDSATISPEILTAEALASALDAEPLDGVVLWFENYAPGLLKDMSSADWDAGLNWNARATWKTAQECIPRLEALKGGLVAVSSRAARESLPGGGSFGIAKTLEYNLVRSLAAEAAVKGVRANLLSLSPTAFGQEPADEIANVIAFLMSPAAAGMNGATVALDGRSVNAGPTATLFAAIGQSAPEPAPPPALGQRLRAIVTGGAGCIGKASVLALARLAKEQGQEGLDVLVADIDPARLAEAARALSAEGIYAHSLVADLGDPDIGPMLVKQAVAHFGGLDVLFSNAGYGITDAALEAPDAQWAKIVEINLSATWRMAIAAFPHLRASGGALVATSSIASFLANARAPMYSATKAALNRLVAQISLEWGMYGVRANLVSPGSIDTPMNQLSSLPAEDRDRIARGFPTPRLGRPEEVAEAVAFLASRKASYISGQNLVVDGGLLQAIR
ncbi:hypothetical protein SBA_ch1_19880 [Sphingomonas bisphenolicum]|uniref:3-oxoacyl-(Acyl-carrier-protein) reductase n=2 Tax=Sphingomonas bisphenolicum TaxID=296544 RepID=A0ABN5WBZ1_9SPHN|nr:hypothetical protein SBA_ch1_19880 [Sphingomonas bisphenolicum]